MLTAQRYFDRLITVNVAQGNTEYMGYLTNKYDENTESEVAVATTSLTFESMARLELDSRVMYDDREYEIRRIDRRVVSPVLTTNMHQLVLV